MKIRLLMILCLIPLLTAAGIRPSGGSGEVTGTAGTSLRVERLASFNEPWAMTFFPDGRMLITEKPGTLLLVSADGREKTLVAGVPEVAYGGQGGLGDIILHPEFAANRLVYLSYAEEGLTGLRGAAVARARLSEDDARPSLQDLEVIWRQVPKVSGGGHYSHRLVFGPDGYLFISSGERQKQSPAQSWTQNLGKVIRLNPNGSTPADNPFQDKGELARTFWSMGHRNILGFAFDGNGQFWAHEMGPRHGDELNLIEPGENYGWPVVSWGDHYSGLPIPDHDTRPEFKPPAAYWVPTIAPSGLVIYSGSRFPKWQGNALIGGLASKSLIRVALQGEKAQEVERFDMGERIREVEQGPDGAIWLLEDGRDGGLLRLTPLP